MKYSNSHNLSVTHPLPDEKEMVAELWKDVFQVSNEYLELFFNRIYQPENTFVYKCDRIISALHVLPFELKLTNKIVPCTYIYGAGTNPSERGKGLMHALLNDVLIELERRGFYAVMLIPAEPSLYHFYRQAGFTEEICCNYESIDCNLSLTGAFEEKGIYSFESCSIEHFPYFDRKQLELPSTIIHRAYDYETVIQDLALDGGSALVALENNNPAGMAFVKKEINNSVFIKLVLSDSLNVYQALLKHINRLYNAHPIKIRSAITRPELECHPCGLAHIFGKHDLQMGNTNISLMLD